MHIMPDINSQPGLRIPSSSVLHHYISIKLKALEAKMNTVDGEQISNVIMSHCFKLNKPALAQSDLNDTFLCQNMIDIPEVQHFMSLEYI